MYGTAVSNFISFRENSVLQLLPFDSQFAVDVGVFL